MRFEVVEGTMPVSTTIRTPAGKEGKSGAPRETATQRQKRQEILLDEIDVATSNDVTAIYKANQCKQKSC
jgi:hypothetical protein